MTAAMKLKDACSLEESESEVKLLSCVQLFAIPWTVAYQAPLYMGFSRQEYWNGLPFPSPGDLPNPGIKPRSPTLQGDSLPAEPQEKPKNTGVGSLSLLQGIFLTQELNWRSPVLQADCLPTELSGKLHFFTFFQGASIF